MSEAGGVLLVIFRHAWTTLALDHHYCYAGRFSSGYETGRRSNDGSSMWVALTQVLLALQFAWLVFWLFLHRSVCHFQ
jgi:hypothetical protein